LKSKIFSNEEEQKGLMEIALLPPVYVIPLREIHFGVVLFFSMYLLGWLLLLTGTA